jgi:hypothetical protein
LSYKQKLDRDLAVFTLRARQNRKWLLPSASRSRRQPGKSCNVLLICLTIAASSIALGQQPAPVNPGPARPRAQDQTPVPSLTLPRSSVAGTVPQEQPPSTPAPAPILENTGKPMLAPFQCTDEDIQRAGLTCSEDDPCPVYLELGVVDASGNRILAAGNFHTSSVTLYSLLLASDDGGHTWREPHERIRAASLEHIQFLDAETGWVTGMSLTPLPQDPFLLVTLDGGKTWRQRPIFSESADNRAGTIQQFSFSAKDSGTLIIDHGQGSDGDRYEVYESRDAGENWSIKESSNKPLRLRRPPPLPSTDWRLRADGPTQSFHIERRAAPTGTAAGRERWTSVAAFSVKVAGCKPQALNETPPEPAAPVIKK